MIIIGDQHQLSAGEAGAAGLIDERLLDIERLVAQAGGAHTAMNVHAEQHGSMKGHADIRQDGADIQKGHTFSEQSELGKIEDARLFKVGQVSGIVEVTLRVQVAVAYLDGVGEVEIGHGRNYTINPACSGNLGSGTGKQPEQVWNNSHQTLMRVIFETLPAIL